MSGESLWGIAQRWNASVQRAGMGGSGVAPVRCWATAAFCQRHNSAVRAWGSISKSARPGVHEEACGVDGFWGMQ
jgi:hypothetical protein